MGFSLQAGTELEFYLLKRHEDGSISPVDEGGYLASPPADSAASFRREAITTLDALDVPTTSHHHEVGRGQNEIGIAHADFPVAADRVVLARLTISELAIARGMIATFMPKPFEDLPGNGMHVHHSLWNTKTGENLFAAENGTGLSTLAAHYVAGVLEHAPALTALVASTVNSFRRLRPGFEAPTKIAWGPQNRTAMIRVPRFTTRRAARVEVRCPDPLCSPHIASAAILAAGLDGIERELEPPEPSSENLFDGADEYQELPKDLGEAVAALRQDRRIREALGQSLTEYLVEAGTATWREYCRWTEEEGHRPEAWDMSRYLLAV